MKTMELNPKEFPTLSTWDPNFLNEILENLSKEANPSKTEITLEDKLWAATMLEMDLKTQSGSIWSENRARTVDGTQPKNAEKMRRQNIPWAESYPGELYPMEQTKLRNIKFKQ
jgi:Arc/MetJ family transcription regulator